jgi:hypothetical protein
MERVETRVEDPKAARRWLHTVHGSIPPHPRNRAGGQAGAGAAGAAAAGGRGLDEEERDLHHGMI